MKTTLRTDITAQAICDGFVYNELEGKGLFGLGGVRLEVDEYIGIFKRYGRNGRGWKKFHQIGNAGVALDVAEMLRELGHDVEIEEYTVEEP
jgi:hypothetical protein